MHKNVATLEGVAKQLCPEENIWLLVKKDIMIWAKEHLSAKSRIKRQIAEVKKMIQNLPDIVKRWPRK